VHGPQESAREYPGVSGSKVKIFSNAEEKEPNCRHARPDPTAPTRPLFPQHSQKWHNNHIEPGYKTSLSCRSVDKTHLLEGSSSEEHQSGEPTPQNSLLAAKALKCIFFRCSITPQSQWQQSESPQRKTDAIKGERTHMIHPHPLGHKSATPNDRCQHQE